MDSRLLSADKAALLIVDIQEKFLPVVFAAERLIKKTAALIEAAKLLELPIVVSEQYPKGLGSTVKALSDIIPESAVRLEKSAFGCLGDQGIADHLKSLGRSQIMVCGLEAHVCVNQTVHQLLAAKYQVHLIEDALATRDPVNLEIGVRKMRDAGALPSCVEMAIFELMQDCKHPKFKAIQALIK